MGGRVRAVVSVTQQMFLPFTCRLPDWRPNYLNVPHKTLLFACVLFFFILNAYGSQAVSIPKAFSSCLPCLPDSVKRRVCLCKSFTDIIIRQALKLKSASIS